MGKLEGRAAVGVAHLSFGSAIARENGGVQAIGVIMIIDNTYR